MLENAYQGLSSCGSISKQHYLSTKSPNLMVSGNKNKSSELEAKPG
jgi:hypothetical protein